MNIRLVGSADLVKAWACELEREYSIKATLYPMRGHSGGLRAYVNLDDRTASEVLKKHPTPVLSKS